MGGAEEPTGPPKPQGHAGHNWAAQDTAGIGKIGDSRNTMPTWRLTIEYEGGPFHGWQTQSGVPTVQETLEQALERALRVPVAVVGAGRTDAGVHARRQTAHVRTEAPVEPDRLRASLNGLLPETVAVRDLVRAPDDFHARYDAILRQYHYRITTGFRALDRRIRLRVRPEPDFERMNAAARALLGQHDFGTFCRTKSGTHSHVCIVHSARWVCESDEGDCRFEISANRFLHGMVRTIVGTLLEIGHGKRPIEDIPEILALKDRRAAGPAAPALGLTLENVLYPGDESPEVQPEARAESPILQPMPVIHEYQEMPRPMTRPT